MRSRWLLQLPLVGTIVLATSTAWALKPGDHRAILEAACGEAQLPYELCRRAGRADYETDYREWETLAAHAQREEGQDRCPAADAAVDRVDELGRTIALAAARADYETLADALGRAMHTIQDSCAHRGMTNAEHAFDSMQDLCGEADANPDTQPAALACAKTRTRQAMAAVAAAIGRIDRGSTTYVCQDTREGADQTCAQSVLPTPVMACQFLGGHRRWDGVDTTWNDDLVGPALVAGLADGLRGVPASSSVCGGDDHAIDPPSPHAPVSDRDAGCLLTDVGCLGSADDPNEGADPDAAGGCGASRADSGLVALALLLVAIGVRPARVRRRARRR